MHYKRMKLRNWLIYLVVRNQWVFAVKFKGDGSQNGTRQGWLQKGIILRHMEWIIKKHLLQWQR